MTRPQMCFLPGILTPLPGRSHHRQPPLISIRRVNTLRASASEPAEHAGSQMARQAGSGPGVTFGALSPPLRAIVSSLVVAASATVAFNGVPARGPIRPVAAASAAVVVASTGALVLRGSPSKAARKYLASSLAELGVDSMDFADRVRSIPTKFGVSDDDFLEMRRTLYEYFLLALVSKSSVAFSELSQLTQLKASLSLSGVSIGDAHFEASRAFYRDNVVYLDSLEDDAACMSAQKKLDKLVFLSDRMYADKDTEEAYRYEKSRIVKFYNMSEDDYQQRIARVGVPFYKDIILRACADSSVTEEDIGVAQTTLGVRDIDAQRVRADVYTDRVEAIVSQKGKIDEADNEDLKRLRALLSVDDERALSSLKTLVEPVFREVVSDSLDALGKGEEPLKVVYNRLAKRRIELSLSIDDSNAIMAKEISSRAIEIVRVASKFLRVQNINSCIKQLGTLLDYVEGVVAFMKASEDGVLDDVSIINIVLPDVSANLSKVEPKQMYRLFMSKCLEDRRISPEEEEQLKKLRAVLNVSEQEASEAFTLAAGPVYKKAVFEVLKTADFSDSSKEAILKMREDLVLPMKTWKSIELDLYEVQLFKFTDGNRIIQEQEAQYLANLRGFLDLTTEDTASVHKRCMGPVYEQSVTEAMGPTGIMLDEYKSGLERLRDRLGLSKADAEDAFFKVVKQRMLMYVNRAMEQLEKRQAFRGQNEERDVGDDPNIKRAGAFLGIDAGGLPIELSNLVDFYVRNGLVKEEEIESEGEKKTVQRYSVTLRNQLDPKVYNELYKQYVIQCFSAQTRAEKQRLFSSLDQLGCILGMKEEEVGKIHADIGTVIYKNYVNQALLKGPLEDKDLEFLKNIQSMLSMKEEQCEKLLKDAKDTRISVMLEQIIQHPKVLPETVKRMRELASALQVDFADDLDVSPEQRAKLFNVEIDAAIENGSLTADNQGLIAEVQNSLRVSDDVAREVLLKCIQRRTSSLLLQAAASLRQNRSDTAVSELKSMMRYGKLLPAKINAPAVTTAEKQELYLLFQADVITDGAVDEASREQINLLKTLFGFTDADLEVLV